MPAGRSSHICCVKAIAKKVFDTIAPRFADRKGGYSRIIKLGNRKGDGADLAIIELLGSELEVKKAERAEKAKEKAHEEAKGREGRRVRIWEPDAG